MINVKEETNGTFTITWDTQDPIESVLNTWTEQDFVDAITSHLDQIIESKTTLEQDDCAI